MDNKEEITAFRLRAMRNYRGISLVDAAARLGMTKQGLHNLEQKEAGMKLGRFIEIAESYDFKIIAIPAEQVKLTPEGADN